MGTHPIFESDFDCLTDNNRQWHHPYQNHSKRSASRTRLSWLNVLWPNKTLNAPVSSNAERSPSVPPNMPKLTTRKTESRSPESDKQRRPETCTSQPSHLWPS